MDEKKMLSNKGELRPPRRKPSGDPRLDIIESGPLRGRQAVTLGMVKATRQDVAALARDLGSGLPGRIALDRVRSIEHTLRILERVARLPADPLTDYRGATP
jgi:hypothetical protein